EKRRGAGPNRSRDRRLPVRREMQGELSVADFRSDSRQNRRRACLDRRLQNLGSFRLAASTLLRLKVTCCCRSSVNPLSESLATIVSVILRTNPATDVDVLRIFL